MRHPGYVVQLLLALVTLVAAGALVGGRGIAADTAATSLAKSALARLGYEAAGPPRATFEADPELAWALERARPGSRGVSLARGEGGAVRWRVVFPGGGEAVVTTGGVVWSARRPAPTAPGLDAFPSQARARVEGALERAVPDAADLRLVRVASWREGGHIWQRGWFVGEAGTLPTGWRRDLELEMVGSTVVAWRRAVRPLGTDLGVVTGRIAELTMLRRPALIGLGLAVIGVLLAAAEGVAYREPLHLVRGVAFGAVTVGVGVLAGNVVLAAAAWGVAVAAVVAVLPNWTDLPGRQWRWGPAFGLALAFATLGGRELILGAGGWTPITPMIGTSLGVDRLLSEAWFPALAEEPLLRGALPALATPVVGWWGAALVAAPVGALLHPLPTVPLSASLALELIVQLGLALAARFAGVGGAVLARGTYESLVRRAAFPSGADWDAAALAGVVVGVVMLVWPPADE